MNPQLQGVEQLDGTYPFDLRVSVRTLHMNRFFWELRKPDHRQAFLEDAAGALSRAGLTPQEQTLVLTHDWIGMVRHGVNFFVLEKLARVLRVSNMDVYAAMRGESLEAFLATRRVPDAR